MFIDLSWQIHKSGGLLVDSIYIVDIRGKTKKKELSDYASRGFRDV